jgi:hypothetical protein
MCICLSACIISEITKPNIGDLHQKLSGEFYFGSYISTLTPVLHEVQP